MAHTRDSKPRAASGLSSAFALAVLLLAVYLQTFGGVFHSIDEEVYLHLTASLAERASFSVEPVSYWPDFGVAEGVDGRLYANRGPGLALAALPFYWLGVGLAEAEGTAGLVPSSSIDVPTTVTLSLTLLNCLTVTALDVLLYLALLRLGYSARVAVSVALLFGLGTLAWPYASKSFFGEPLLALCCLLSFYCLLIYRQRGGRRWLLLGGLALGWAVLTKVTAFLLIPFLLAYALWPTIGRGTLAWELPVSRRSGQDGPRERSLLGARPALPGGGFAASRYHLRRGLATTAAWFVAGLLPFVAFWLAHNHVRFGNPLVTGYELEGGGIGLAADSLGRVVMGLGNLIGSSGKGVLWYAPPVVLGVVAARRFWRSHPAEAVCLYGSALATLVGVCIWRDWSGGWCWGPRLLLNVVPFLVLPSAEMLSCWNDSPRRTRWVIPAVAAISVAVQLVGVLPNYLQWYMLAEGGDLVYFDPSYSPIAGHLWLLQNGQVDLFWDKVELFFPQRVAVFSWVRWMLAAAAAAASVVLWRLSAEHAEGVAAPSSDGPA